MKVHNPPEPEAPEISVQDHPSTFGLPHSREAEEAVIGAIMINPEVYDNLSQFLTADDFYIHRLRFIWQACERLVKRNCPLDSLMISEELDSMARLDEIGGPAYLAALLNQVPTTLYADSYGEIIHATSIRRKLLVAGNEIANLAYNEEIQIDEVLSKSEQAISGVTGNVTRKDDVTAHEAVNELYDHVDYMCKNEMPPGVLTGSKDYDVLAGGLRKGTYGLVGARPGMGKTALMLTWITNIYKRKGVGVPHIILDCMEMTPKRLVGRMAAIISGVDAEKIRDGKLTDQDWPAFNHAVEVIASWPLMIIDERDPLALIPRVKVARKRGECDILFVDYIGKFEAKADNRVRQVAIASSSLSKIAIKNDIPVVSAAQVNRTIDTRGKDSELVLSDLKETGDLEQDADWVLFINPDSTAPNLRNCNLAKNRDGKVGRFELLFKSSITKFENVDERKFDMENYRDISGERD